MTTTTDEASGTEFDSATMAAEERAALLRIAAEDEIERRERLLEAGYTSEADLEEDAEHLRAARGEG